MTQDSLAGCMEDWLYLELDSFILWVCCDWYCSFIFRDKVLLCSSHSLELEIQLLQLPEFWNHSIALPQWVEPDLNFILCMWVFACMYVCSVCMQCLQRQKTVSDIWAEVIDSCEPPCRFWESNSCPREEKLVFLFLLVDLFTYLLVCLLDEGPYVAQDSFEHLSSFAFLVFSFQSCWSDRLTWFCFKWPSSVFVLTLRKRVTA